MNRTAVAIESIVAHFESLPDPRHERNRRHRLGDIIVIAVCGVIVGCDGPTSIERWAKAKRDWLGTFLDLPGGIPSRDCFRRVLSTLKPEAFQECFQKWIAACIAPETGEGQRTIAIDGKTIRRSHDHAKGLGPLHLVSAWASEQGVALGQLATEEKSNEITAIPDLLDRIDVRGAVVTIDAMGCQTAIAERIVEGRGDYVLAVKANQKTLYGSICRWFELHLPGHFIGTKTTRHETCEKGHGREESRWYYVCPVPDDLPDRARWPSLKAIGMAVTTVVRGGKETTERRYYILSRCLSARRFAEAVRGHWGIENSLHWVLDVTFDEDQSRTRERRLADNLSWLRRFAITLLKHHPSQHSLKGKSQMAGWNNDFLLEVLAIQRT